MLTLLLIIILIILGLIGGAIIFVVGLGILDFLMVGGIISAFLDVIWSAICVIAVIMIIKKTIQFIKSRKN